MSENLSSERRLIANEAVFRTKNESTTKGLRHLASLAKMEGHDGIAMETSNKISFYCECSDENCRQRVTMAIKTYEKIHKNRKRFSIRPSHHVPRVEKVIERHDDYTVVEKHEQPPEKPESLHKTDVHNV